jgi:hypothetical protein
LQERIWLAPQSSKMSFLQLAHQRQFNVYKNGHPSLFNQTRISHPRFTRFPLSIFSPSYYCEAPEVSTAFKASQQGDTISQFV